MHSGPPREVPAYIDPPRKKLKSLFADNRRHTRRLPAEQRKNRWAPPHLACHCELHSARPRFCLTNLSLVETLRRTVPSPPMEHKASPKLGSLDRPKVSTFLRPKDYQGSRVCFEQFRCRGSDRLKYLIRKQLNWLHKGKCPIYGIFIREIVWTESYL